MDLHAAPQNIPLHCNICEKKPDFSDVSHLLTHVASKGHLSSYYKMKVKSGSNNAARKAVEDYDDWYATWNVDDLMRERMSQKEKKKGSASGSTSTRRGSAATTSSRSTPVTSTTGRRASRQLRDGLLDPQLDPRVKVEPLSRSVTPAAIFPSPMDPVMLQRTYIPPMQTFPATPYAHGHFQMKMESFSSSYSEDDPFDFEPEPEPSRPARRGRRVPSYGSLAIEDEWDVIEETITDASKLKGVHWPGMAMFDSATAEMKRKRNQKKAYSVVQQLQATSEIVEPNEMIFDASGLLRKQRTITGNPELQSDDSLLSGEMTPEPELLVKKRHTRRPRPALVEKNVNTNRPLRRRGSHHPPSGNKRGPYYDGPDEEEDDLLTYGKPPPPKKRTGLSIHRDNSGPDITFDHSAPFNFLTSGFSRDMSQPSSRSVPMTKPSLSQTQFGFSHQRQPSYGLSSFRPSTFNHSLPSANFASFGHLNTQTLFQHSALPIANGQTALQAFQQQFGVGPQHNFGNDNNPMFQPHAHFQPQTA